MAQKCNESLNSSFLFALELYTNTEIKGKPGSLAVPRITPEDHSWRFFNPGFKDIHPYTYTYDFMIFKFLYSDYSEISLWMSCEKVSAFPSSLNRLQKSCKNLCTIRQRGPATWDFNQASSCVPIAMISSTDVLEDHLLVSGHQSIGGDINDTIRRWC